MKNSLLKIVLSVLLIGGIGVQTIFAQTAKPRFVVSVSGELDVNLADVLTDEISHAIIKSGKYDLIANDRQFKTALKKEWESGNVDDDKIIALAQKAGANYLCFAKIKSVLGSNQITAQLVDLKTMLYGSMGKQNGKLNELDDLTKISQAVVAEMLGIAGSAGIGGGSPSAGKSSDEELCDNGDYKKCSYLAVYYANYKQDYCKAEVFARKACNGGYARGCGSLGILYHYGYCVTKDLSESIRLLKKGCSGKGEPYQSCRNLGHSYYYGEGVAKDILKAADLYEKSCDGNDSIGCYRSYLVGNLYLSGDSVVKDACKAMRLFKKACEREVATACNNLGIIYDSGSCIAKNVSQAFILYKKSCDGGIKEACENVGTYYKNGWSVSKDYDEALEYFKLACEMGSDGACKKHKETMSEKLGGR